MASRTFRALFSVIIYALIALAVLLAIRQGIVFFARLERSSFLHTYAVLTSRLVMPIGLRDIKTPYGGVFDLDNATTVVLAVAAEWLLSAVRDRA